MNFKKIIQIYKKYTFKIKKNKFLKLINSRFLRVTIIPPEYTDDKDIILAIVKKDGLSLEHASYRLQDDEEIVLEAIKQHSSSLYFASNRLKDKDVVLEAVLKNPESIIYASERLQGHKDLLEILEKSKNNIYHTHIKKWYDERMEFLANIRRQEEKKFMENSIICSDIKPKKLKF